MRKPIKGYIKQNRPTNMDIPDSIHNISTVSNELTRLKNEVREALEQVKNIKEGPPGKSVDEDSLFRRLLNHIPKINEDRLLRSFLSQVPKIDENKLFNKFIAKIPEQKTSLKVIRETFETDPLSVIKKIMELPPDKFKLKSDNIDGLQQTISAINNQLGRGGGYLHGGGDTVVAGTDITITTNTNGQKVISSTASGTPGGSDTQLQYNNSGAFGGTNLSYNNAVTPGASFYTTVSGVSADGSDISFTASNGGSTLGRGGNINLVAGDADGGGDGGSVSLQSGVQTGGNTNGYVQIKSNTGAAPWARLSTSALTADRIYAFPDAAGTIALTSDITGFVTTDQTVGQTIGSTGARLTKLWATDITVTNAISGSITGNAATATALETARTIAGVSFNGTANIAISLDNLSDVVIATPLVDQILKYNGTNWVNGQQTSVNAGSGVDYFYNTTNSDIGGYDTLERSPQNVAEQDLTVVANNNSVLFMAYSSPSGGLGGTQIDAGVWSFDIYAYADLLTLESHIDIEVYKRTSGGTETLLFTVSSGTLSGSIQLHEVTSIQQAFATNATDRLVVKVYGVTSNVTNTNVHFVFGGTENYSSISTPLVVRHNDLAGLQGGTSAEYYHLTSAEYTGTGTGNFVRTSSPTITTPAIAGATITGVVDAGGADSFEIPNGAGGTTINAAGEVCVDTTSDTLNFYDGTLEAVLNPVQSKSITIESPTAAEDLSMWYTDDAITITKIVFVITGSTSATTTIRFGSDRSAAGTEVVTGGTTANSTTTGNVVTSFNDATIPADNFVWLETTALSSTPTSLSVTIYYRQDA